MFSSMRFFYLFLIVATSARSFLKRTSEEKTSKTHQSSKLKCIDNSKSAGEYYYISPGIEDVPVCGLYIMGMSNQVIELEFTEFDVDCDPLDPAYSIVVVVDGWELNYGYFPSLTDHAQPLDERIRMYCGHNKPRSILVSSQNAALVKYVIPKQGQGFRVIVRMPQKLQPCNVISGYMDGLYTIRNFGKRMNCSMLIIYPENIRFLSVDVGITSTSKNTLTNSKCSRDTDFVELLDGNGLDPDYMPLIVKFCGQSSRPAKRSILLGCNRSVVRIVSSGKFYNSVTFAYTEPSKKELEQWGSCEVDYDEEVEK